MKNKIAIFIISCTAAFCIQSCSYSEAGLGDNMSFGEGTGGSMARFTVANNHLYTVDQSNLKVFDLSSAESPEYKKVSPVGFGVETIFPLGDKLFLGTNSGMYIYDVSSPVSPRQISFYEHVVACDPVVSDGDYAYVTLSSVQQRCWRPVNELQIIDLKNMQSPQLLKQYPMDGPRGLAINNDTLWVCDNGLKVFDVSDKTNIVELFHFSDIPAYDVILDNNRALVIGEAGFTQYILEADTIRKLSEINIEL